MNRTLGELVDRLSILNLKIWFVQDELYRRSERHEPLSADNTRKLATLNLDRTATMAAIDQCLERAVKTGEVDVDSRLKITDSSGG